MMDGYFNLKGPTRLCDALGFDELLELRGLKHVEVEHVHRSQGARRTNEERKGLELALRDHIFQDDDDDDSE